MKKIIVSFLSVFMFFTTSSVYASSDIPYFKTVRKEETKLYNVPVLLDIQHIENVENKTVQKQINALIDDFVKETLQKQSDELKDMANTNHIQLGLHVSDYYVSKDIASFSLDFLKIMADSYEAKEYHTIDLKTGKNITIDYWLGQDYAKIIKNEVIKQVNQQNAQNGNELYFMNEVNNLKITKDQSYYINKDGQIVVTFPMSEIAPAYVGIPEFIMPCNVEEVQ